MDINNQKPPLILGEHEIWNGVDHTTVFDVDRRRGCYVVGQTGTGKSTLLHNMVTQDILRGECVVLVDPHGSLADEVAASIPQSRLNDVIVVDPTDIERPVGQNPLYVAANQSTYEQEQKLTRIHTALHGVYADSWGPELERVSMATLMALVGEHELKPTLFTMARLIEDKNFRKEITPRIKNRAAWRYFNETIKEYRAGELAQKTSSTSNKLFQVLASTPLAHMYGQYRPSFDLREAIAQRKIIILRIPIEGLTEQHAALCGAIFVTELYQALAERSEELNKQGSNAALPDTYLYIDEFHKIRSRSFDKLFAEARKVNLNLTVAHQYLDQLAPSTAKAVLGNAGTSVFLRPSPNDIDHMVHSTGGEIHARQFSSLANGQAVVKLLRNGEPDSPKICNLYKIEKYSKKREQVISNKSRFRYGRTLEKVIKEVDQQAGFGKVPSVQADRKLKQRTRSTSTKTKPVANQETKKIVRGSGSKKREFYSPELNVIIEEWHD